MNDVAAIIDTINKHFYGTNATVFTMDITQYDLETLYTNYLFNKLRDQGYITSLINNVLTVMLVSSDKVEDNRIVPGFIELHYMTTKRNNEGDISNYEETMLFSISSILTINPYDDKKGNKSIIGTEDDYHHVVETISEIKDLLLRGASL